jgi:prepilin-type N-terminal cleavage/methylation domain-containing protein
MIAPGLACQSQIQIEQLEIEVTTMKTLNIQQGRSQGGFTLIEIAIVLVIIGLLLGGVLQGQQLIENSRVKSATNSFNGTAAAIFSYQDRYGRLPGDDGPIATLTARGGSWSAVTLAGNANGILQAPAAQTFDNAGTGEGIALFQHLRAAGFITGDPSNTNLPQNPFGGLIGITNEVVLSGGTPASTMPGIKICMSNVSGSAAQALDTQLDDGAANTGRFRAIADPTGNTPPGATAVATPAYDENTNYTVCYRM